MNNDNSNTRILIAITLSVLFLIPYMYFFSNKETKKEIKQESVSSKSAPIINSNIESNLPKTPITNSNTIATITSKNFDIKFDDLGRIHSVELKGKKWSNDDGSPLNLIGIDSIKPLEMRYKDQNINKAAFSTPYKANSSNIDLDSNNSQLILTQDLGEIIIKKDNHFL